MSGRVFLIGMLIGLSLFVVLSFAIAIAPGPELRP